MIKLNLLCFLLLVMCAWSANAMRLNNDDSEDNHDYLKKRDEAVEFYKRLFHFGTKNEEIKRETKEVYEEKCESIVPTQRFVWSNQR